MIRLEMGNGNEMTHRYAVLRSLDTSKPVGIVVERPNHVLVDGPDEYGLERHVVHPYRVLGRDLHEVVYNPGTPGYFDQVLAELGRLFAIGKRGTISRADS